MSNASNKEWCVELWERLEDGLEGVQWVGCSRERENGGGGSAGK